MSNLQGTVADRIAVGMSSMSGAEKRAARTLLARYPVAGLESVTDFAEQSRISTTSVLRFIAKLGYSGYPDFRRALRDEVDESRQNPLTLPRDGSGDAGSEHANELLELVRTTLGGLDAEQVAGAVELLADTRRNIYIIGGNLTSSVASYFSYHLQKMRQGVFVLPAAIEARADRIVDIGKRDILIVFDTRRYQADVIETARFVARRGGTVILMTDQWLSPISDIAKLIFSAKVATLSPWDSLLGLNAIIDTICLSLDRRLWTMTRPRLEAIESCVNELHKDGRT